MTFRLDIILADGSRRRANYDTDRPDIIEIARCPFGPADVMLNGAACITSNPDARRLLEEHGFHTQTPGMSNNYCIRMDDVMAEQISAIAARNHLKDAAVIRHAVQYWLDSGHPLP